MIDRLLEHLTRNRQARTIRRSPHIYPPYLTRWYLRNLPTMPDGSFPFDRMGTPKIGIVDDDSSYSAFLHRFGQDDEDDVHCHPWTWGASVILSGGYIEERLRIDVRGEHHYDSRVLRAPAVNFLRHSDFHRVTLIGGEPCWTLFFTGKQVSSWGFIERATGEYYDWRTYFKRRRIGVSGV